MTELRRVAIAFLAAFAVILAASFYWGVVEADRLTQRADNSRNLQEIEAIQRGKIYDRQGILLAATTDDPLTTDLQRVYPHPEVAPVTGYYSLRYGTSGIEATYNTLLSGTEGTSVLQDAWRELLHQPRVGGNIRLTLDLGTQQAANAALAGQSGAIIVAAIPDGAILAMASAPVFNPNTLDTNWGVLVQAPDAPLINRVTQGLYQPGTLMGNIVVAAALSNQISPETPIPGGNLPIQVNGLTLNCITTPPSGILTLGEAYLYGCPAAFAALPNGLTPAHIDRHLWRFGQLRPPTLTGLPTDTSDSPLPLALLQSEQDINAALTGQGALTVTPLQVLEIIAVIANNGNAPRYHIVDAIQYPGEDTWQTVEVGGLARAVMTAQNAQQLQTLLGQSLSPAVDAANASTAFEVAGQTATAYSGPEETPLQWFIGMARLGNGASLAVVCVLEDTANPEAAAQAGLDALLAAARTYTVSTTP